MTQYGMTEEAANALADSLPGGEDYDPHGVVRYDPEWREAKVYEPANEDGHRAVVLACRAPAVFWRVKCPDLDLDLSTGSDMGSLATAMAEAIANGCLGPHTEVTT